MLISTALPINRLLHSGTEYPINPLDMTRLYQLPNNETICLNTFAPQDLSSQGADFILGDSFLRNVYALFNYGNWTTPGTELPYVQLLSVSRVRRRTSSRVLISISIR